MTIDHTSGSIDIAMLTRAAANADRQPPPTLAAVLAETEAERIARIHARAAQIRGDAT